MAVAQDRSMNMELIDGATDGTLKKASPNRGGIVEKTTAVQRADLFNGIGGYGFAPDGSEMDAVHGVVRGC